LPVQPIGSALPEITVRRPAAPKVAAASRATSAVPSRLIVDQDHVEFARIGLAQQRGDRLADAIGLVTGRNNGTHEGPAAGRNAIDRRRIVAFGRAPEPTAGGDEIKPDQKHH